MRISKEQAFDVADKSDARHGFKHADAQGELTHKFACDVIEWHERVRSAAPAMLEALEQLLDDMGEDGLSVCQAAKDQAKAALAKARGEITT